MSDKPKTADLPTQPIKIADLKPAEYNPRQLTEKQFNDIRASIKKFGFIDPIIVNKHPERENVIIGGHQRCKVAESLGYTEVPAVFLSLTIEEEKELNVRHNKNTGEWDFDILANQFDMPDLIEWGFEAEDFGDFGEDKEDPEVEEDEAPEVAEEAITEPGTIYQLGEHRLMCGDSTSEEDVARLMNGEKADMVFTDPPYGVKIVSNNQIGGGGAFGVGKKEKLGGKRIEANKYADIIGDDSIETAVKSIKVINSLDIKTQIIWGGNYYANKLENSNCWIVWDKETGDSTFADAELAWTNQETKVRVFKHRWSGICKASEHGEKRVHPTQKPVALAAWCFDVYGEKGQSVLDLFGGSGSTLIACEQTDRKCRMMEMSPSYCDVIVKRYCKLKGIDPEKVFESRVA